MSTYPPFGAPVSYSPSRAPFELNNSNINHSHSHLHHTLKHEVEPQTPKYKISWLKLCIWLLPVLLAIVCLIAAAVYLSRHNENKLDVSSAKNVMKYVSHNLHQNPINQIQSVISTSNCPDEWKQEEFGKFDGVDAGCLCNNGKTHNRAYCYTHWGDDCKKVDEVDDKKLNLWKKGTTGTDKVKLCIKTNAQWAHHPKADCPTGETALGNTGICYKSTEFAPLNKITQAAAQRHLMKSHEKHLAPPTTPAATPAVRRLELQHKYDFASEAANGQPYVSIRSSLSTEGACWDHKLAPELENHKSYPLGKVEYKKCGEFGKSSNTEKIGTDGDALTVKDVWENNGIAANIADIPFYKDYIPETTKYTLFAHKRIVVATNHDEKNHCENIDSKAVHNVQEDSISLRHSLFGLSIAIIVFACIIIIVAVLFYVLRNKIVGSGPLREKNSTKILYILAFFLVILALIAGIIYLSYDNYSKGLDYSIAETDRYITHKCFESTNPDQSGIVNAFKSVHQYATSIHNNTEGPALCLFIASIVFVVLAIILIAMKLATEGGNPLERPF